jgi:hypothetical protein
MKNLANCTPSEFIRQTVRLKKAAQDWLDSVQIIDIIRRKPTYIIAEAGISAEERAEIIKQNAELEKKQGLKNLSDIMDAAFEQNPEKTLELLALTCFVEPSEVDNHPITWYMQSIMELIQNEEVLSFFTSLAQLARTNTSEQ